MLEIVFKDRDNSIGLLLKASTINDPTLRVVDLTNVTKMILTRRDGYVVDSTKEPNIFDWMTLASSGIVIIQLGHVNITKGKSYWRLVVFDSTNQLGIVWGDKDFVINVKEKYASNS